MPLEDALELQHALFAEDSLFRHQLNIAFDAIGFTEEYVNRSRNPKKSPVLIKDSIWGMMEFLPDEVALIDTPLLQRMRTLHQLGLSWITYPSAEHSRFSHSLGVSHVVKRFLRQTAVNQGQAVVVASTEIKAAMCDRKEEQILRHAALLHDIGHFPFSHATETIFQNYPSVFKCGPSVERFLGIFAQYLSLAEPKLAECLSIAIVLSPRFGKFYRTCVDVNADDDILPSIALVIGGKPARSSFPGLCSILSHSNVDADKVDYLRRDSEMCGIPVGIDAARLFFRSMFVELNGNQLSALAPEVFDTSAASQKHFIVNASGLDTVDEIIHARATMYQRVYMHKATRLAERLFEKAFIGFIRRGALVDPQIMQYWSMSEYPLLDALINGETVGDAAFFGWRIKQRAFPKRALIFGGALLRPLTAPPIRLFTAQFLDMLLKQAAGATLSNLRSKVLFGQAIDDLEAQVEVEATSLANLVRPETNAPIEACRVSILPMEQIDGQNKDHIILEGSHLSYHRRASRRGQQVAGDEIDRSVGYIFTEPDWREFVQVAARRVLHERARSIPLIKLAQENRDIGVITLSPHFILERHEQARRTGVNSMRLERIEAIAARKGYFDKTPKLLPYGGPEVTDTTISLFRTFDGVENWCVTRQHCLNFLEQFPPPLRPEAHGLLSKFKILGRAESVLAFTDLLVKLTDLIGADRKRFIAPFTPSSGSKLWNVLKQSLFVKATDLGWAFLASHVDAHDALRDGGAVVFVDDNISSGSQARASFRAFVGQNKDEWPEELRGEENAFPPRKVVPDGIAHGSLYLAAIVAETRGLSAVESDEHCRSLGVTVVNWKLLSDYACPPLSKSMREFLATTGESLVRVSAPTWNNPERHGLGYDGLGALLATPDSVPAGTITPFWMPGHVDGTPWLPLLLRRGYQKNLVV